MNKCTLLMGCFVLAACGSGDGGDSDARNTGPNDVEPMLIAGGGVSSGAIHGEINVHAIDDETGVPIAGANVRVGGAAEATPLENVTDASGLAVFIKPELIGAQTVTVVVAGYAAATWFGVNGANVTVPLARNPRAPVPSATVSGTISLPAPTDFTNYSLAVVLYSWSANYGARENTIVQPMNGATPANLCVRTALDGATCNWTMKTRVGKQLHYAVIVNGDTNGTTDDPSDDTYELLGYAVNTGLELSAGQTLSDQTLTMMPLSQTNVAVQFPSAPALAGERSAFPFIDAGEAGQLVFPLPTLTPGSPASSVPALAGPFAGMSYLMVGLAVANAQSARPYSATFDRGVTLAGTHTLAPFLPVPSGLTKSGDTYSFTPVPGAATHLATLADAADNAAWTILVLDGASSFTLPALSPDPRAGRTLQFRLAAAEISGFNPNNFGVRELTASTSRVSEATD